MKKIIFASAALIGVVGAMDASAQCASGAASQVQGAAAQFVLTPFTPKCSANVTVVGIDATSYYAVGAVSAKGKSSFRGSTAGGGVIPNALCSVAGACDAGEATTAASAAPSS